MGLFDRRKNKGNDIGVLHNAININDLNENTFFKPFCWDWKKKGRFDFGAFFLQLIIGRIYNGMRNVTWGTGEINYLAADLTAFIDKNEQLLLWSYWSNGYACSIVDDKVGFRLPKVNERRTGTLSTATRWWCTATLMLRKGQHTSSSASQS